MRRNYYLLDLLGVFVADKNNNGINVNAVEPFDSMRGDVEQTVAALHPKRDNRKITSASSQIFNEVSNGLTAITHYSGFKTFAPCVEALRAGTNAFHSSPSEIKGQQE